MPQAVTFRTRARDSRFGAICVALLFWQAWQQVSAAVQPILAGAGARLINHFIHYSQMVPLLESYRTLWKIRFLDIWFGFLLGAAAVMLASWLYSPDSQR